MLGLSVASIRQQGCALLSAPNTRKGCLLTMTHRPSVICWTVLVILCEGGEPDLNLSSSWGVGLCQTGLINLLLGLASCGGGSGLSGGGGLAGAAAQVQVSIEGK